MRAASLTSWADAVASAHAHAFRLLLLLLLLLILRHHVLHTASAAAAAAAAHLCDHHQCEGRDDQGCRRVRAREVDAAQLPDAQVDLCFRGVDAGCSACLRCALPCLALLVLCFACALLSPSFFLCLLALR